MNWYRQVQAQLSFTLDACNKIAVAVDPDQAPANTVPDVGAMFETAQQGLDNAKAIWAKVA